MDHDQYCREVEAHLRRRNDGHLIRIVGPAFELVRGWAEQGIPLRVVQRGVDRHVDRVAARGAPRRRPVRIEFCEADVLDAFDEWRRAVGTVRPGPASAAGPRSRPRQTLAAHIDRVVGRLAARRTDPGRAELTAETTRALDRLDALRATAARARGAARAVAVEELARLDETLMAAARRSAPPALREALAGEAARDLAPFRARMTAEVYDRAVAAATDRLLRERLGLPTLRYE